jgi:hypothetical protein
MRWEGHIASIGETKGVCRILVENPERKRSLGRSRRRWEDTIKIDFRDLIWVDVQWVNQFKIGANARLQ